MHLYQKRPKMTKINSTYDVVDVNPGIHVYKRVQTSWTGFQASETVPAQCTESVFYIQDLSEIIHQFIKHMAQKTRLRAQNI